MTRLSFQLYSARNFPPLADTLAILAAAGYSEVEGYGGVYGDMSPAAAAELKELLDKNGLTMPTGHFGIDALEGTPDLVISFAKTLGIKSIYCPYLMPDQRPKDAAGWTAFGTRLQEASAPYRAAGFDFGWHNHDFEFVALSDGSYPQDRIMAAGPSLSWEMDVAWVVRGGADPFAWIEKYKNRITSVHVKDIAPKGENANEDGWADVGHGVVPWGRLMTALKSTKAAHFVVEHDNPSDLKRLATRSIASVKSY